MKLLGLVEILLLFEAYSFIDAIDEQNPDTLNSSFPVIVITWNYKYATEKGILRYLSVSTYQEWEICKTSGNLDTLLIIIIIII